MKHRLTKFSAALLLGALLGSCQSDPALDPTTGLDKLVIGTNITTANPVVGYVGTLKDWPSLKKRGECSRLLDIDPFGGYERLRDGLQVADKYR